jgi:hypothetical protein
MASEVGITMGECVWTVVYQCLSNPARVPGTGSRAERPSPQSRSADPRGTDGAISKRANGGRFDDHKGAR